jgi:DNA-binding CsgD family transcriptional regulator
MVETLLETGAVEAAADAAAQLQAVADSYPSSMLDAAAALARGRVRLAQGDPGGAMHGLEHALSAWLRLSAPYLAAGARVLLGLACRGIGDVESTRMHFEAARECFIWLGAQPALRKLEALDASPACPTPDAGLSRRELEVLRLLATGQTNKGIARELGLSEKTVERHLSSIFDKLQVHTRSAATAFAFRHGLLPASP